MRVLFLSAEYPPETGWGGIGSYVACMAQGLAACHDVHVLSCAVDQRPTDNVDHGVHVHRRRLPRIRGANRSRLPLTIHRLMAGGSAYRWAQRLGVVFDVVEYPEWNGEGWVFALGRRTPSVAHLHTPLSVMIRHCRQKNSLDVRLASSVERFSVHRANSVTSPSKLLADEVAAEGWNVGDRLSIVPYPMDWKSWREVPQASEAPPIVQFVGRVEPRKAPETLVDAIGVLRREIPNATARFVGKYLTDSSGAGPLMPWCPPRSFDGCSFVGQMARNNLPSSFATCRVVAQPSLFENFSVAGLEAMAAGRALVVNTKSGLADFVLRNKCGEVVPSGDAAALAEALKPYLVDPQYAAMVGKRAQEATRIQLDPRDIAKAREQVYENAINAFRRDARSVEAFPQ